MESALIKWFRPTLNRQPQPLSNRKMPQSFDQALKTLSKAPKTRPYSSNKTTESSKRYFFTMTEFSNPSRNSITTDLLQSITQAEEKTPLLLHVNYADNDSTDFNKLASAFPSASALWVNHEGHPQYTHTNLWDTIKYKKPHTILILQLTRAPFNDQQLVRSTLPKIISGYFAIHNIFNNTHPFHIFKAYNASNLLTNPRSQSIAKSKISNFCAHTFNRRPSQLITLTCIKHISLTQSFWKSLVTQILKSMFVSNQTRALLYLQTSIILKGNPKLRHIICNHIQLCKQWSHTHKPQCQCNIIAKTIGIQTQANEHISATASTSISSNLAFSKIFACNLNNVCQQHTSTIGESFFQAIHNYLYQIMQFLQDTKIQDIPWIQMNQQWKNTLNYFQNQHHHNHQLTLRMIKTFADDSTGKIQRILNRRISEQITTPVSNVIPNHAEVLKWKNKIGNALVIGSLDKSAGSMDIFCPTTLWNLMETNFWNNRTNYTQTLLQPSDLMYFFRHSYKANNWNLIARYNTKGEPPYPYFVRKAKDITKIRPIVSFFNHPLKKVLQKSASGFLACLKALPQQYNIGNIFNTRDMIPAMIQKFNLLKDTFQDQTEIIVYAGDIKEMYTHLPQHIIIQAIHWILNIIKQHTRRNEVSVHSSSSKQTRIGKSYSYDNSFTAITFNQLFNICLFEIYHCYFILSNTIFKQIFGIPIGSLGSAGYSMAICIHQEWIFHQSLFDFQKLYTMSRYMDDLRALIVYKKGCSHSKSTASTLINMLATKCYHETMILVPEQTNNNTFTFLEAQLTITNKSISSFMHSKNWTSLISTGKQKFINAQHFHSFTGEPSSKQTTRIASILGRFAAITAYSYPPENIILSFIQLFADFKALGYPTTLIKDALYKKYHSSQQPIWILCAELAKFLQKQQKLQHT
jgi:hypothetical protein